MKAHGLGLDAEFNEADHPRDGGKFTSGAGSSGGAKPAGGKKSSVPYSQRTRRGIVPKNEHDLDAMSDSDLRAFAKELTSKNMGSKNPMPIPRSLSGPDLKRHVAGLMGHGGARAATPKPAKRSLAGKVAATLGRGALGAVGGALKGAGHGFMAPGFIPSAMSGGLANGVTAGLGAIGGALGGAYRGGKKGWKGDKSLKARGQAA